MGKIDIIIVGTYEKISIFINNEFKLENLMQYGDCRIINVKIVL